MLTLFRLEEEGNWVPLFFLEKNLKVLVWGFRFFLTSLAYTHAFHFKLEAGLYTYCLSQEDYCMNALYYLNLYLDILQIIGFQHFIAHWKALNKRKQISQFLQRNFAKTFAQMPLMLLYPKNSWHTYWTHAVNALLHKSLSDLYQSRYNSIRNSRFKEYFTINVNPGTTLSVLILVPSRYGWRGIRAIQFSNTLLSMSIWTSYLYPYSFIHLMVDEA